jgi:hypothetical protein
MGSHPPAGRAGTARASRGEAATTSRGEAATTRRAALAGGVGAGALAAGLMSASRAEAQLTPPDDRYVWRERFWVNVKDHGAVGNGTTNDTPSIRAAIQEAVNAGGGTVFFPPGDYVVNPITDNGNTVGLTIPPEKPIRLLGSGMSYGGAKNLAPPTRLIRKVAGAPILKAVGSLTAWADRVYLEVNDLEFRGSATTGTLVHIERGNTVQLRSVSFVGVTGTGLLMRNVYNSSGSDLRWTAAGNGTANPACLFDGVTTNQGGSDTVMWTNLQFEGNGGTDLKMTGDATNTDGTVTSGVSMSQVKMEGGTSGAANCPYIDLDYTQSCKFSNVGIGMHGGRTVAPLRKSHPYGGTRADQFVNLSIDKVGTGTFPCGIDHIKAALLLENVTILGVPVAIRVNATVAPGDFHLGNLNTNCPRAVEDLRSRSTVTAASSINPPRERLVGVVVASGTPTINNMTPHEQGYTTTLIFQGTAIVDDSAAGSNLRLASSFSTTPGDTLTLITDGTNWFETSRSVN